MLGRVNGKIIVDTCFFRCYNPIIQIGLVLGGFGNVWKNKRAEKQDADGHGYDGHADVYDVCGKMCRGASGMYVLLQSVQIGITGQMYVHIQSGKRHASRFLVIYRKRGCQISAAAGSRWQP